MNHDKIANLYWLPVTPADFGKKITSLKTADLGFTATELRAIANHALTEVELNKLGRAYAQYRDKASVPDGLTPMRLVILSNATSEHLARPLVATALRYGIDLRVMSIAYNEATNAALQADERILAFAPNVCLLASDYRALSVQAILGHADDERAAIDRGMQYMNMLLGGVHKNYNCKVIVQSIAQPPSIRMGHADRVIAGTERRIFEGINAALAAHCGQSRDHMLDIAALVGVVGSANWFDERSYNSWKLPFSAQYSGLYCDHIGRVLGAMAGKSRRVLVLDLDNTLWGGVIGDDGVDGIVLGNGSPAGEAYRAVQRKALELRERGILLAVASKNDDANARLPFQQHADMILKEDHFAAFRANWGDKATNIREIATELALGLDSFVFVDDNPAERALVRKFLPEVAVPEMPEDPADYAAVLDCAGYFEAVTFSEEDSRRAELYKNRSALAKIAPADLNEYLRSLNMRLVVDGVHAGNRVRVTQLINKSNQFNLTTRRYTEEEVMALEQAGEHVLLALRLVDDLDDHGIISVIIAEKVNRKLDIVLWVMSCRVIGRKVEQGVMNILSDRARGLGVAEISGRYIPSQRNSMVEKHYENLGFTLSEKQNNGTTCWSFALPDAVVFDLPLRFEYVQAA